MGDFSASGIERTLACPPSAALTKCYRSSVHADRGTSGHTFAKRVLQGVDPSVAILDVQKDARSACEGLDFDRAVGGLRDVRVEVAFAVDVKSDEARVVGYDLGRAYPPAPAHVIHGTTDVVALRFDDIPVVGDWKFGHEPVTACRDNPQMMFAARAAQMTTGARAVEARILYVRSSGRVDIDGHTFEAFDLDGFVSDLARVVARVLSAKESVGLGIAPTVYAGDHCRYCDSLPACPAHTALARAMVPELAAVEAAMLELTPEQGGIAWQKMKAISALLDRVESGLKNLAARAPLPVGDGKEVRPVTFGKTYFKKDRALQLLVEHGASREEILSCEGTREETQYRTVRAR